MPPSEQDHLPVRAAAPRAPSDELLVAVAAGLTRVAVEPGPEWSGIPTQRPASADSGAAVPLPLPSRPVRPDAAALPTLPSLPKSQALPIRPRRS